MNHEKHPETGNILYLSKRENISFDDLAKAGSECFTTAFALAYGTDRCSIGLFNGGRIVYAPGSSAPVNIFELRVFDENREMRWVKQPGSPLNIGDAILFGEQNDKTVDWPLAERFFFTGKLSGQYILWGTAQASTVAGWSRLFDHRIGDLPVPLPNLTPGSRVRLTVREYLHPSEDPHGNQAIIAERLTGLVPFI